MIGDSDIQFETYDRDWSYVHYQDMAALRRYFRHDWREIARFMLNRYPSLLIRARIPEQFRAAYLRMQRDRRLGRLYLLLHPSTRNIRDANLTRAARAYLNATRGHISVGGHRCFYPWIDGVRQEFDFFQATGSWRLSVYRDQVIGSIAVTPGNIIEACRRERDEL